MAERRMFAKSVVLADTFLDLPGSAKVLYFMLGMTADDDGFVHNPKSLMRQIGVKNKDMELLERQGYVMGFPSGVAVICHWKVNNKLRSDRYRPTVFREEFAQLSAEKDGVYRLGGIPNDNQPVTTWDPQDRLGKDREGKVSLGEDTPPTPWEGDACKPIIDAYNRICVDMPRCKELTKKRVRMISEALERGMDLEEFERLFKRAQQSSFLRGLGENGFIAGIDWLLKETNMAKVLEGNFDDRREDRVPMGATGHLGQAELEALQKMLAMDI